MSSLKDLIIDAAEIATRTRRGLYYLAPFARRVSFASQQLRAFNLIWALHADGRIRSNDRVAVIGAGVAGVTAACALRAYGCAVDIYDRASEPMWRQREASHRMVHPNINFWPAENGLLPTTSQPFMEWYYQPCTKVIDRLFDQWKEFVANDPNLLKFRGGHDISNAWGDHGSIFLEADPNIEGTEYKTAIVAVGFGDELVEPKFTTIDYWKPDTLESDRSDKKFKNFVISGCGDGGMIDALRVAYDFGSGRLAIDAAATLAGTEIEKLLAEYDKPWRSLADEYMDLARKIGEDPTYEPTRALLGSKLHQRVGLVIMVDSKYDNPFKSGAAPIHKLMVAYARTRGVIRYDQGSIGRATDHSITAPFSPNYEDKNTRVVVRHGANLGFGRLLTTEEVDEYKRTKLRLTEYNFSPAYKDYPALPPWPKYDPADPLFRSHRRPLAEQAIGDFGGVSKVKMTLDGFEVIHTGDLALKPKQLFGIATTFSLENEAPTEEALV